MPDVNLEVEIYCHVAKWTEAENLKSIIPDPIYRVYVDDDLLTERTWIWNNTVFIKENVWARLNVNRTHCFKIEPIIANPAQARFNLKNFTILNNNYELVNSDEYQVTFKL